MMNNSIIQKKICLLGMFGVGKTSLVRRFVYDRFEDGYLSTIGVKVSQKLLPPIQTGEGKFGQFNFLLWDIEGFEENSPQLSNYLVGAAGALVVADLLRPETIASLPAIISRFRKAAPAGQVALAGNKIDLAKTSPETVGELERFAAESHLPFLLTSAKTGENVEKSFQVLARQIAQSGGR